MQPQLQPSRLNLIEISSPCSVPWETMPGDDRVRYCGQCRQNVFNVAGLTRFEAERLLANREGRLCARILLRPDGTVVTADCWSRLRAARRRGLWQFFVVLVLVVVPELVAIRFGLATLRRAVGLAPPSVPALALGLPPRPDLPDATVMLGGIRLDEHPPAAPSQQREMEDANEAELPLGLVGRR